MPPESLQWDRKEFYKERKHERQEQASPPARWRDTPRSRSRDVSRWESADLRRSGHGKQGVWHLFNEESGHGFNRHLSEQKMLEEDRFKFPQSSLDGKYSRHGREIRGNPFCFKDSKANSPETSCRAFGNKFSVNDKRPAVDMLMHSSHRHSNFTNSWEQTHTRKHIDSVGALNAMDTGKSSDRDDPASAGNWGSLKWTRPGSLSSRGSGFNHLITPGSSGVSIPNEAASVPRIVIPVHSPSEEALPSTSSTSTVDFSSSRKRQRLGWGEGLAKYERNKEGINECSNTKSESCRSLSSNVADKSPEFVVECTSPATPYSHPCSSSPGIDDKSFTRRTSNLSNAGNLTGPPGYFILGGRRINLDSLEQNSVSSLSSSLMDLLESEDINLLEPAFVGCTAMTKLLAWKESILNALEATESDIDKLESELKLSKYDSVNCLPSIERELSFPDQDEEKSQQLLLGKPSICQNSCDNIMIEDKEKQSNGEVCNTTLKDGGIDGPSTSKSGHVEPCTLGRKNTGFVTSKHEECSSNSNQSEEKDMNGNYFTLSACSGSRMDGRSDSSVVSLSSDVDDVVHNILKFNRNIANESSGVLRMLLPSVTKTADIPEKFRTNEEILWRKFVSRKRFLHFKERVITLKFQALLHMWNEDMLSLSTRKIRSKSQKKTDLSIRTQSSCCQKHPLSNRFGSFSPGNPSSSPTTNNTDVVDIVKMLLSPPPLRIYREALKMPALILDSSHRISSRFVSYNSLVEDPCAVEKERAMINPWSPDEKKMFIDNLAIFGKNFRKIASFLKQKTTADCVEFYYKNHKSDCFQKKKKLVFRKHQDKCLPTSTYLVTSEKKRNHDISSSILGTPPPPLASGGANDMGCVRPRRGGYRPSWDGDSAADTMGSDRETDAADALMEICSIVSSEAAALNNSTTAPAYSENAGPSSPSAPSRNSTGFADGEEGAPADWTDAEKCLFLQALSTHGREFTKVSQLVGTKSRDQCRIFFSKARKCLRLDSMNRAHTDATDVGHSDEDEDNAVICDTQKADIPTTLRVKVVNPGSNSAAAQNTCSSTRIGKTGEEDEAGALRDSWNTCNSRECNRSTSRSSVISQNVRKKDASPATMDNGDEHCRSADTDRGRRQGSCLKKCKSLKDTDGPCGDSDT